MSDVETLETRSSEKGEDRQVMLRLQEIKLAKKAEKDWRKDAEKAILAYRSQSRTDDQVSQKETFNILWANTEIKRQAVYNNPPRPDIRKRHQQRDLIGKTISELMEKCVTYVIDCEDLDGDLIAAVNDMLLPGRAVTRVKYSSVFVKGEDGKETDEIESERVTTEQVQYCDLTVGPGKTWHDVPWIAFEHDLTKDEVKKRWPEFADSLTYGDDKDGDDKDDPESVFKKAEIYEVWDKDERKVYWIAPSYKDKFLEVSDDPLELKDFWPIPEPLRAIEDSTSLIPITEYSQYYILAKELEIVSRRRNKIADALRVRGVYDSTIAEMDKVFESADNEFIPAENLSRLIEAGGLDKAIWMLPIDKLISVYQILGQQRADLIGQIYEITGISDIVRGDTNPNETLGAQQIKASYGNMRIDRQRTAVQKYARDLIRLIVEVISDKFSRETLALMSGMNFPTAQQKQQAQMSLQSIQMMSQGNPQLQQQMQGQIKQAQEILAKPSWDEIEQVLKSDMMREYRIDVETDSTIAADQQKEQQNVTEFLNAMGQFFRYASDGVNSGMIDGKIAKMTMASVVRKFKMGRDIEEEIDAAIENPQENPAQQQAQQAQQAEQQAAQQKAQVEQMKADAQKQKQDFELQKMQMEQAANANEARIQQELDQAKLNVEAQKLQLKEYEAVIEQSKLGMQAQYDAAKHEQKMAETMIKKDAEDGDS